MNDNERQLLRAVVNGDQKKAKDYARVILVNITSQKDQRFRDNLLRTLDAQPAGLIELPHNLKELLIAEDVSNYPTAKFLLRDGEMEIANRIIATYKASKRLMELGIPYLPAAIFYGESGTGKTELARYIAYKANIPYVYVRFSSLVNSYLGGTQSNISKVFAYAKTSPCLLCFDEIDAIGMKREDNKDVSEMNRVVIALMQELDALPNNVIIIGTTNRFDRLDPALVRRFPINYKVDLFTHQQAIELAEKLFNYVGYVFTNPDLKSWCDKNFGDVIPVSSIITKCTNFIVDWIMSEEAESSL